MSKKNTAVFVLDAGGTGFKFTAVADAREIIQPFTLPSAADTLDEVLQKITRGFRQVQQLSGQDPLAISFSFPGPADYENGIIGDLENLTHFRGGVPLKAMLEEQFNVPVFINNDGDLFAYGEALSGLLPETNLLLERAGNPKRYHNLIGLTFGTGLGGGIVCDGKLLGGDNSAAGEINRMRNFRYPQTSAEDSVSIRGIKRNFCRETGIQPDLCPEPQQIYEIATGSMPGNRQAAISAFHEMAEVAADTIANALTLIDGLVVIGGGLSGAWPLYLNMIVEQLNKPFTDLQGHTVSRLEITACNLESDAGIAEFVAKTGTMIRVPFSQKEVWYDPSKKVGVGISRLGTSSAVAIGAYAYAMDQLNSR
ncbi:MAG: ROK family protein [Bacteroidales bacterium]|nr:ROK family protein [Bacteroidales bacterium]